MLKLARRSLVIDGFEDYGLYDATLYKVGDNDYQAILWDSEDNPVQYIKGVDPKTPVKDVVRELEDLEFYDLFRTELNMFNGLISY